MVTTKHPNYQAAAGWWQRCRDLYAGSDAVKAGNYLPHPAGMSSEDYAPYKERAQYVNVLARTVNALTGVVCERPLRVEVPDSVRPQLDDVTLRDESLAAVASVVVRELLLVGRGGVLLDMPEGEGGRPYWVLLSTECIINWRTASTGTDPHQLVQVVFREDVTTADEENPFAHVFSERYRELALNDGVYQARVWTRADARRERAGARAAWDVSEWVTPVRRGTPLPFIPFTFVGVEGITPDVSKPPLLDLVDVSIGHYRNSADHEHGLFLTALPTPWVSGVVDDGELTIGPSHAWRLEKDGRAGLLEFTGAGLAAIRDAMTAKEKLMATLGASLLEEPAARTAETATAIRMRHSGQAAALKTVAGAASAALTRVLRWHVWWWAGAGELPLGVQVRLSDEFFQMRATPEEVRAAIEAVQSGQLSFESLYALLEQGGWTRPGVTAADERHAIDAADEYGRRVADDGRHRTGAADNLDQVLPGWSCGAREHGHDEGDGGAAYSPDA